MLKLLLSLLLISTLATCANTTADTTDKSVQQIIADVSIKKFKFIPETLEIKKGQKVRWTNKEKRQYHSVWFEKYGEEESEYLFPDDIFEKTFDKAGEFEYRCGPHPEMTGKIIVK